MNTFAKHSVSRMEIIHKNSVVRHYLVVIEVEGAHIVAKKVALFTSKLALFGALFAFRRDVRGGLLRICNAYPPLT